MKGPAVKEEAWRRTRLAAAYGYCADDEATKDRLVREASAQWDGFYARSQRNFFKDRHWLGREFPLLLRPGVVLCELGCGVGNSTFPLLAENASLRVHCSDFSAAAVALLRADPRYDARRIASCTVADCSDVEQVATALGGEECDAALLVFVLSAMGLEAGRRVAAAASRVLRRGGVALVRDYCEGDAAQLKFEQTPSSRQLGEQLYCRGDGTQALFFGVEVMRQLWQEAGYEVLQCEERMAEPAATGGHMRRFVQGQFRKP